MSTPDERARLTECQAELVRALLRGGERPAGFDADRLDTASAALAHKRRRAAAAAWPALARERGARFAELFAAYRAAVPLPRRGGPSTDAYFFARWLDERGELPAALRPAMMSVRLRNVVRADGLLPRRGPAVDVGRSDGRWHLALRWPGVGEWWLPLPLPRRRACGTPFA